MKLTRQLSLLFVLATSPLMLLAAGHTVNIVIDNQVSCFGEANGHASASVTGGVGPFSFNWSNGASGTSLADVPAGSYTVTVTDESDMSTATETCIISEPAEIVFTATGFFLPDYSLYLTCSDVPGASYTWTGDYIPYLNQQNVTLYPPSSGGYYQICVSLAGCQKCLYLNFDMNVYGSGYNFSVADVPSEVCQGNDNLVLPTTSVQGITGTWNPPAINTTITGSSNYIFTPNPGQGVPGYAKGIEVLPSVTPEFTLTTFICEGETGPALPTQSNNGILGTWVPNAFETTTPGTQTALFTPDETVCAFVVEAELAITETVVPQFSLPTTLTEGQTAPSLPTTSDNAITGVWSPTEITTSTPGVYHYSFTPTTGQCADPLVLEVEITSNVGINESAQANIEVYPNPATDQIVVKVPENVAGGVVTLKDAQGKTVMSIPFNDDPILKLDLQGLSKGLYTYRLLSSSGILTGKLMVL